MSVLRSKTARILPLQGRNRQEVPIQKQLRLANPFGSFDPLSPFYE
ncbi:hypothetical protein [Paenibacillus agri]|uniref:Uncharacterized protein n=1 Tax=Paenibacillus agri TaxID=2744309 RepID=A0A850EZD6_9BACL|nr:hypothetical protein [Paenibacillus agri]NUU63201.1 hypothetical protein [Paenibacillus agri]